MRLNLLQPPIRLLLCVLVVTSFCVRHVHGSSNDTAIEDGESNDTKSGVIGPPKDRVHRRLSRDMFKNLNSTRSNSSSVNSLHQKRSPSSQVQILESGSAVRNRGEARVLKRGPGNTSSRFADSVFTLRNSLKSKQNTRSNSGYDSSSQSVSSSSSYENIPLIPIPGNNIPPPIYTIGGNAVPAPPPSSVVSTGSSYESSYKPGGSGGGGGGGGGFIASTTSLPEIIFPPDELTPEPGPKPIIGPGPGTSVPIIGGGGGGTGGGGSEILPPSPPPDEIFPPAPPPEDEFDFEDEGLGRRLKVTNGSGRSASVGSGGNAGGVRTRTRIVPSQRVVTSSRLSSPVESKTPLLSARERVRTGGGTLRRDRLRDKVKEFKTTVIEEVEPVEVDEIIVDDPNVITDFVFSDIKCFKTRQNEYFGATIHLKSGFHLPYIRDRPQDPLSSEECRLEQVDGSRGSYHMAVTDLRGCGVEQCGEAMCLTMVFPRVPMLALADDEVTTIKCIPQKSTISDTKSISFAGDSTENRRSSSTVEGGVQEFVAEVGVFRQNPGATNGLFVKRVNSGGVVQLGEPLQLRSVVRGTDGWKHSKLTDVKVWRMHDSFNHKLDNLDPNQASEVITLVDGQGCRNDEYVVIADDHPIKDPRNDMVHHFTFKAFLFRGQRVNEPLVVTARVHACQEYHDCLVECGQGRRVKRSPVEINNASAIVHGFDSKLALRVVGLKDHPSSILDDEFAFDYPPPGAFQKERNRTINESGSMTCNEKMFATGLGGGCIMLLICGLGLALYTYIKQGRLHQNKKNCPGPRQGPPPAYRYHPPPSARAHTTTTPYQKPLPPTPPESNDNLSSSQQQRSLQPPQQTSNSSSNQNEKTMSADISQVAKLLQELAKNNNGNNKSMHPDSNNAKNASGKTSSGKNESSAHKHKQSEKASSEYACIDETSSSVPSSSSSSSEDLSKHSKKGKDGVYIVYCYNDKKNKVMLPMSAPSSTRLRRKHLKGKSKEAEDDDEEDFIDEDEHESESQGSQMEEMTEESDEYGEIGAVNNNGGAHNNAVVNANSAMASVPLEKNQVVRRTVREVKKKSKQNNCLAFGNSRSSTGGIIRRRVSSVYREGYLSGIRGAVVAAVQGSKNVGSVRFKKAPSLGHLPSSVSVPSVQNGSASGKRINFSVRERRSARKRRQQQKHYNQDQYSSEGMLSEGTTIASDLDSAYSGSNCSKLTEDHLYELKRAGAGRYPDFRDFQKLQQNLMDVQRQLMMNGGGGAAQGPQKQEVKRTSSSPNTTVAVGGGSPPLSLGETKATHFVTRDDSTTKILIVPETHV